MIKMITTYGGLTHCPLEDAKPLEPKLVRYYDEQKRFGLLEHRSVEESALDQIVRFSLQIPGEYHNQLMQRWSGFSPTALYDSYYEMEKQLWAIWTLIEHLERERGNRFLTSHIDFQVSIDQKPMRSISIVAGGFNQLLQVMTCRNATSYLGAPIDTIIADIGEKMKQAVIETLSEPNQRRALEQQLIGLIE